MEARWALTGCFSQTTISNFCVIEIGAGKINAALSATEQILKNNPLCVIQFGTAGRLDESAHAGVMVGVTSAQQCDYGGYEKGKFYRKEINGPSHLYRPSEGWTSSAYLLNLARITARNLNKKKIRYRNEKGNSSVLVTCIFAKAVSCDQYIIDDLYLSNIATETKATIIDMETASTAEVCNRLGVPFLAIRVVTDTPEHNPVLDFRQTAEPSLRHLADWLTLILENIDKSFLIKEKEKLKNKYIRHNKKNGKLHGKEKTVYFSARADFFAGKYKNAIAKLLTCIEKHSDCNYKMYQLLALCYDYIARPDIAVNVLHKAKKYAHGVNNEHLDFELEIHKKYLGLRNK